MKQIGSSIASSSISPADLAFDYAYFRMSRNNEGALKAITNTVHPRCLLCAKYIAVLLDSHPPSRIRCQRPLQRGQCLFQPGQRELFLLAPQLFAQSHLHDLYRHAAFDNVVQELGAGANVRLNSVRAGSG